MQNQLLQEILQLKALMAKLVNPESAPEDAAFSPDAIAHAAKQFQQWSIERGDWVQESEIRKIIKSAPCNGTGVFIRNEFGFTNYFKRGRSYYFNRKALEELAKELKARNVDLGRLMEYQADVAKFKAYVAQAAENNKGKRKAYHLPEDLHNITKGPVEKPAVDLIQVDIQNLKEVFFESSFDKYIDIYKDNYAMMRFEYGFDAYFDAGLKRRCKQWCYDFNYANHALEMITGKKAEKFIPVKEDDMLEL